MGNYAFNQSDYDKAIQSLSKSQYFAVNGEAKRKAIEASPTLMR